MPLWTPSRISTALWLDAADSATLFDATSGGALASNTSPVLRVADKSGNVRNFTQSVSGSAPTRRTGVQNSLDVLRFSSSFLRGDSLASVFAGDDLPCSIFSVFQSNNTTTNQQILWASNDPFTRAVNFRAGNFFRFVRTGSVAKFTSATSNTAFNVHAICSTGLVVDQTTNGTLTATAVDVDVTSVAVIDRVFIGAASTPADFFDGDLGELIVLGIAASSLLREQIEGYLAHKWGIASTLPADHPYKNAAPSYGGSSPINGQSLIRPAGDYSPQQLIVS